jgi:hypothetical protein
MYPGMAGSCYGLATLFRTTILLGKDKNKK